MAVRQKVMKKYALFNKIGIDFLNPYTNDIDLKEVLQEIENKVPASLFNEIEVIYVGSFDFLDDDGVSSKFMDNAIYLSNSAYYESDIVYDIVSALAESIEKKYVHLFYGNEMLVRELENCFNLGENLLQEGLIDTIYDFLIEGREEIKEKMPIFSGVLEEIMRNG